MVRLVEVPAHLSGNERTMYHFVMNLMNAFPADTRSFAAPYRFAEHANETDTREEWELDLEEEGVVVGFIEVSKIAENFGDDSEYSPCGTITIKRKEGMFVVECSDELDDGVKREAEQDCQKMNTAKTLRLREAPQYLLESGRIKHVAADVRESVERAITAGHHEAAKFKEYLSGKRN